MLETSNRIHTVKMVAQTLEIDVIRIARGAPMVIFENFNFRTNNKKIEKNFTWSKMFRGPISAMLKRPISYGLNFLSKGGRYYLREIAYSSNTISRGLPTRWNVETSYTQPRRHALHAPTNQNDPPSKL